MVTVTELNRAPDGTFESLEVTGSITDPQGNTVTDLSRPVQVTEEASTFSESDITLTQNNTTVSSGSVELSGSQTSGDVLVEWDSGVPADLDSYDLATFQRTLDNETVTVDVLSVSGGVISDFEDGDITTTSTDWDGWNGDTGNFTAQTSTVLSGSQSGELSSSDAFVTVNTDRGNNITTTLKTELQISSDTGNTGDGCGIRIFTSGGTDIIGDLAFEDSTKNVIWSYGSSLGNTTNVTTWSTGTTISVKFNFDFQNDTAEIFYNGTSQGTFNLTSGFSGYGRVRFENSTNSSDASRELYIDDVESSDTTVEFSDIGKNFDISTIGKSENVALRANLSRANTANNPTIDYLARRFNRS